jgi:hypothetical protein
MKPKPEYVEGPEAWQNFASAMGKVIKIPYSEIQRRVEAEKQKSAAAPVKRGSKPGVLNHVPRAAKRPRIGNPNAPERKSNA